MAAVVAHKAATQRNNVTQATRFVRFQQTSSPTVEPFNDTAVAQEINSSVCFTKSIAMTTVSLPPPQQLVVASAALRSETNHWIQLVVEDDALQEACYRYGTFV
jgi:hypothetical protein